MLVPQTSAGEVLIWNGVSFVRVPLAGQVRVGREGLGDRDARDWCWRAWR